MIRSEMNADALARLRAAGVWHDEPEVVRFLAAAAYLEPAPERVVEFGSHRMHDHDPTSTYPDASWTGIDWREGPGVNLVGLAHEAVLDWRRSEVDVVFSISALEHDPHWSLTVAAAVSLVRPRGLVAITCAGPEWGEHEHDCAPGGARHYRNVSCEEIVEAIRLAAIARRMRSSAISWYESRTYAPHWPRTCVLARFG